MGGFDSFEAELDPEECNIPRLPLLNPPTMHSPERSGMQTPPLHTLATVPFGWEEEPGKPRPCTALVTFSNPTPKCLELPPRLLLDAKLNNSNNKLLSPTTVLEGPYVGSSNSFHSPSFRVSEDFYGSSGAERSLLGSLVLNKGVVGVKEKGWFGSWREKTFKLNREASGGSHVFPSSLDKDHDYVGYSVDTHKEVRKRKMKRSGSFSNPFHAKSCVWTAICEGLEQVVPWRSKKLKK